MWFISLPSFSYFHITCTCWWIQICFTRMTQAVKNQCITQAINTSFYLTPIDQCPVWLHLWNDTNDEYHAPWGVTCLLLSTFIGKSEMQMAVAIYRRCTGSLFVRIGNIIEQEWQLVCQIMRIKSKLCELCMRSDSFMTLVREIHFTSFIGDILWILWTYQWLYGQGYTMLYK